MSKKVAVKFRYNKYKSYVNLRIISNKIVSFSGETFLLKNEYQTIDILIGLKYNLD